MHTTIVLKHRKFRGTHPYICRGVGRPGIDPFAIDASCSSFKAALQHAKQMGCDTVITAKDHAPRDAKLEAARAQIELLFT